MVQLQAERVHEDGSLSLQQGCAVTAPLNPDSRFDMGFHVMFGETNNPQWQADMEAGLFFGHYLWEIGKVGLDSRAGWAAFANAKAGYAFAACFAAEPDLEYPDNGSAVEFWTVGRGKVANLDFGKTHDGLVRREDPSTTWSSKCSVHTETSTPGNGPRFGSSGAEPGVRVQCSMFPQQGASAEDCGSTERGILPTWPVHLACSTSAPCNWYGRIHPVRSENPSLSVSSLLSLPCCSTAWSVFRRPPRVYNFS